MSKKITIFGVLLSVALVFSYIEFLFPLNNVFPGVKLGLSNIVVIFALYKLSFSEALSICVLRILISGLLFGGPSMFLFSLFGGIFSFFAMFIAKRFLDAIGVGIVGGVFHNIGQLLACIIVTTFSTVYLLPILLISGVVTGFLTGGLSKIIVNRIKI